MKIVILSQYYPPEVGAPQGRLSELAKRFVARGHHVSVVTAMPNYPSGRIHDGYGGLLKREEQNGVSIVRTYIYPTQQTATLPRLLNYISFAASASLLAPWFIGAADYLLVESPPLFLGPAGWWLSLRCGARFIFNVSDLWPESAVRLGVLDRRSRAFRAAAALEAFCYRRAWLVTGQSRSIIADIRTRFPELPTFHVSNGVDTQRFGPARGTPEVRRELADLSDFVVLYAGLHGLAQGLDQVLAVASRFSADRSVRFVLVGDGPEKSRLLAEARAQGLMNVSFLPTRPFSDMPALFASADIVIVSLKTEIPGAVPSKLYEAMASGRPTVLVASGEAADIVREHGAGIVVRPGDIDALAQAILDLRLNRDFAQECGRRGRRAAEEHFDRNTICDRFIDYLEARTAALAHRDVQALCSDADAQPDSRTWKRN